MKRLLVTTLILVPMLASAKGDAQADPLLAKGDYAGAAKLFETRWAKDKKVDALFNAAFYNHRAGNAAAAAKHATEYLAKDHCEAKELSPRRVRHCGLAAELAGKLTDAEAFFKRYRALAKLWQHRSRADGALERIRLKLKVKALTEQCAAKPKP